MNKQHITYKELLEIISWGIFSMDMRGNSVSDKRLCKIKKVEGAVYGGIYVGSPGRDIYYMLPHIDNEQMEEVAVLLCNKFLKTPPRTYANTAACLRFIYGQFEKQGALRSEKDFKEMKKKQPDWTLSEFFLKLLEIELKKDNNYYGLSILYEMIGHRSGDKAVINKDRDKLEEMEENYNKCVKYARKCKGYKYMFSIYYWAYEYFKKFGDAEKAAIYAKKSIKNASKYYRKYFIHGDQYYSKRLMESLEYIKKNDVGNWDDFNKEYGKSIKNKFKM